MSIHEQEIMHSWFKDILFKTEHEKDWAEQNSYALLVYMSICEQEVMHS